MAVGFCVAAFAWIGLAWIPRRLAPAEALRAFAAARGLRIRGDGRRDPVTVVGVVRGRPFTLTWQRPPGGGDVLLVGVDCEVEAAPVPPDALTHVGGADAATIAADAALVTRWVRPGVELFAPGRLEALLDAMATMAEELEADAPGEPADPE